MPRVILIASLGLILATSGDVRAGFISNGSFEQTTGGTSGQLAYGGYTSGLTVTGWTSTGYNFLYNSGQADATGATGESGNVKLWGARWRRRRRQLFGQRPDRIQSRRGQLSRRRRCL